MSYKVINITGGDLHYRGLRFVTGAYVQVASLDPRHRELHGRGHVSILNMMDDINEQEFMPAGEDPPTEDEKPYTVPDAEPAPAPGTQPAVGGTSNAQLNPQQTAAASAVSAGATGGNGVSAATTQSQPAAPTGPTGVGAAKGNTQQPGK